MRDEPTIPLAVELLSLSFVLLILGFAVARSTEGDKEPEAFTQCTSKSRMVLEAESRWTIERLDSASQVWREAKTGLSHDRAQDICDGGQP